MNEKMYITFLFAQYCHIAYGEGIIILGIVLILIILYNKIVAERNLLILWH